MKDFVVITDTHFSASSNVRSGDLLEDLSKKLQFVVDYCNKCDAQLLHAGDLFDKATVPDLVKTKLAPILMKLKYPMLCIQGNHDLLYNNTEFTYKTSLGLWDSHGVINSLQGSQDFGEVIVTSEVPITAKGKPQIVLYHGFLNKEDGKWSLKFTDIQTKESTMIVLGHDHCQYDDIQYTSNVRIIRPGSFTRTNRASENQRHPQLVHIRLSGDKLVSKKVAIPSRAWEEVFKTKEVKITKSQQHNSYEDVINLIRQSQSNDLSLKDALSQVASPEVVEFAMQVLEEEKSNKANTRV